MANEAVITLDQPNERKLKKVLVATHCEGRQVWALLDAEKVGRHYQVNDRSLTNMMYEVRLGDTQKRVSWG